MHINSAAGGEKKNHAHTQVTHWKTNWDTHCHILGGRVRDALRLLKDRWITQSVVCHRARRQEDTKQAAPDCGGILGFFSVKTWTYSMSQMSTQKKRKKTGSKLQEKSKNPNDWVYDIVAALVWPLVDIFENCMLIWRHSGTFHCIKNVGGGQKA